MGANGAHGLGVGAYLIEAFMQYGVRSFRLVLNLLDDVMMRKRFPHYEGNPLVTGGWIPLANHAELDVFSDINY